MSLIFILLLVLCVSYAASGSLSFLLWGWTWTPSGCLVPWLNAAALRKTWVPHMGPEAKVTGAYCSHFLLLCWRAHGVSSHAPAQFCHLLQGSPQSSHRELDWGHLGNKIYENDSESLLISWDAKVKLTLVFLFPVATIISECECSTLIKMYSFPTTNIFVL